MSTYSLTRSRTFQYVGILLALAAIAAGYWYFSVRAGVKTNTSGGQPQGIGDLSAGLYNYFRFDEGSGTTAANSSAMTATPSGTLTNGPTWTTGQIGSAIDFDGTDDYVTFSDTGDYFDYNETNSIIIAGWFNRDTFTTDDTIIAKRNSLTNTDAGYITYIDDATDQLIFEASDGADEYSLASASTFTATGWNHFVIVFDPESAANSEIYINGTDNNATDTGSAGITDGSGNALTLRVGAESDNGNPFDGKIDEIRVYYLIPSADDVAALYRLTTPTGVDTGLKGYWSFNSQDIAGTNVSDRSGNWMDGTLTNGPVVTEGRVGQAVNFDGGDDYLDIGYYVQLNDLVNLSACAWIHPDSYPTFGSIFGKQWELMLSTSGGNVLRFYSDWNGGTDGTWNAPPDAVPLNTWSHVCVTYNNSSAANDPTMYINGLVVSVTEITTPSGTPASDSTTSLKIGAWDGPSEHFDGEIDEARIYNRILTAAEVRSLYDRGTPDRSNTSAAQPAGTGNLNSGLAGYWKLDENTGTSAADASVNGNTGTLTNGPTWTTGQIGSAVNFDGADDYISVGDINQIDGVSTVSISAWVNQTTLSTSRSVFSKYFTSNAHIGFGSDGSDSSAMGASVDGSGFCSTQASIHQAGVWEHWSFVFDGNQTGNTNRLKIYKNGVQQETTCGGTISATTPSTANAAAIGADSAGDGPAEWNGSIDEVRVYDRTLSPDEVAQLYRLTTPTGVDTSLKGYWSFNGQDTTSTTAYDRSGVGNNGTLSGGPPVVEGRVGQALSFDNVNDYVLAGSPSAVDNLETQGGGGLTASAWIYPESGGTFGGTIVGKRSVPSPGGGDWAFTMHQDGDAIKFFKSYSTTSLEATTLPGSIVLNKWQYVTATWSGGSTRSSVTFYIDGVLVPTSTSGGSDGVGTKDSDASNVVSISSQFVQYDGLIDEVRLYNRILSAAEVKALHDIGAPDKTNTSVSTPQGTGRLDSGLAGYWKLDENTGTSASDSSTNGNTGTLTNGPTWTTGRIGSGIDFDGTNDYVTVADSAALDFGDGANFSLSIWFNRDTESTYDWVMVKRNGSAAGYELVIGNTGDYITFTVSDGTDSYVMYSNTQFTTTGWHHVVISWDDSSEDNSRVYIDGIDDTTSRTGTFSDVGDLSNATAFSIGENPSNLNAFDGKLDEARVYNRALSPDEVVQLYRLGAPTGTDTNLKGYWSFNGQDTTATTAADRSGAGNTGTLTNGPTVTEGKLGQALSFDGTNDYVTMGDIAALDGVTAMTASAWVKTPSGMSAERHIVDKAACTGAANSGTFELWHSISDDGKPSFTFYKNGGSPSDYRATSSVEMDDNQWHLITGTYDGAAVRIYVDGVETGSTTAASITSPSTSNAVQIGGNCNGNPFPWLGSIDEVRLYNRALSASEIKTLYSSGR